MTEIKNDATESQSLNSRTALVTGASRGIGATIAKELAAQGHRVIGTATSQAGADAITDALKSFDEPGLGIVMNLSSADSIAECVQSLKNESITILVNNAGITRDNLMLRMKADEWNDVINTNLTGVYTLTQALIRPMMKARWGRIINITSVVGIMGNAGQANYAAAKAGLIGFTKSIAREFGSRGITANAVAPGFIETDMTAELSEEQRTAMLQNIALGRLGQTDDIAAAVSFLASDSAGYITGNTLNVNGGLLMP